jgi:hypothetical protein
MSANGFQTCTIIIPIPKRHNVNASDSVSNRGFALSSLIGRILVNVTIIRYSSQSTSSESLFDIKATYSTNHSTMILKDTVVYYVKNQSFYALYLP